ncbi:MAG: helix-turn-helix domain-containing protein [Candidatus Palauibacterales bacterium]|nr:helix-turn-helix domain-containing protein [Candidatus Palauibacterales bacterium]
MRRARIVRLSAEGLDNQSVAEEVGTSRQTVGKWRKRFRWMADVTGLARSTVHRPWNAFGLQPPCQKHVPLSTDPFFAE